MPDLALAAWRQSRPVGLEVIRPEPSPDGLSVIVRAIALMKLAVKVVTAWWLTITVVPIA